MRSKNRITLILAFGFLVATALGATGSSEKPETSGGSTSSGAFQDIDKSWEIDTSPVTLSIFVDVDRDWGQAWGEDDVSKQMIEDTGVNLEWLICTEPRAQLRLLIASGDLPDIIQAQYVDESPEIVELARRDLVWDLMTLSEMYAPSFMRNIYAEAPHALLAHRLAFGTDRMFAARSMYVPYDKMDNWLVMRNKKGITVIQQLYEEIGSPTLETADDYIEMLREVKRRYPDMIPVQSYRDPPTGESPRLVTSSLPIFGLAQEYFREGDTVIRFWEHPRFVELLKFANTLYTEKLVNQAEFTQGSGQLKANVRNGTVFSELMQDSDNVDNWTQRFLRQVKPDWNFMMIEPFAGVPGVEYAADSINGGTGYFPAMISKQSDYPDRAIRFLDYVNSDQFQLLQQFGVEGVHHTVNADGYPEWTDEIQTASQADIQFKYGVTWYWNFRQEWYTYIQRYFDSSDFARDAIRIASEHYEDHSFYGDIGVILPESDEAKIFANVSDYYSQQVMSIITGPPANVETGYRQMVARMRQLGLDQLNEYYTERWNAKVDLLDQYRADLADYLD